MAKTLGDYGITDYTALMSIKPRSQNFLQQIGLFPMDDDAQYLSSDWVELEREEKGYTEMYNVERGADRQFAGDDKARLERLRVPYATLDKVTKPHEVQNFREYGTESTPATVARLVERRLDSIRESHAKYIRDCQYNALVNNTVMVRNEDGTLNTTSSLARNFSTLWNAPRNTGTVDLTNSSVDPFIAFEEGFANIIDQAGDNGVDYKVAVIVPRATFSAIVTHPKVEAAYSQFASTPNPMRGRLGGLNRAFEHKGILILEDITGKIPADKAYLVPLDFAGLTDAAFSPADVVGMENETSVGSYLFLDESNHRKVVIESDLGYMASINRPELITDYTVTL